MWLKRPMVMCDSGAGISSNPFGNGAAKPKLRDIDITLVNGYKSGAADRPRQKIPVR